MPVYKIILPKQPSSYEPHVVITAHVHSWPSKGMEALQTSPAQSAVCFPREKPHHILMGQSHRLSALIDTDQSISRGQEQSLTLSLCQSYNWQRNLAFISRGQIKLFYVLSPQIGSSPSKSSGTRLSNLHKILFSGSLFKHSKLPVSIKLDDMAELLSILSLKNGNFSSMLYVLLK